MRSARQRQGSVFSAQENAHRHVSPLGAKARERVIQGRGPAGGEQMCLGRDALPVARPCHVLAHLETQRLPEGVFLHTEISSRGVLGSAL